MTRYDAMLDQCKSKYHQSKIETADQRKLFHMIDGMFTVKPFPLFPSHTSVQELTERFSAHFTNKIANLRQNMVSCTAPNYTSSISALKCSLGEFNEVTPETVHAQIKKSPSKSCPLDPIPTRTLKACTEELVPAITSLVNSSLLKGIFPNAFKEGRLLPKIKKTTLDKEELDNFRPITNLAFVSKIIERSVARQCNHYLVTNHLYPKLQAAYQQFHSTETALLRVQNDILRAIDDKKEVILVLLDLSAAFDTIDHNILLSRLQTQYGSTDTVIKWFEILSSRSLTKSSDWRH